MCFPSWFLHASGIGIGMASAGHSEEDTQSNGSSSAAAARRGRPRTDTAARPGRGWPAGSCVANASPPARPQAANSGGASARPCKACRGNWLRRLPAASAALFALCSGAQRGRPGQRSSQQR